MRSDDGYDVGEFIDGQAACFDGATPSGDESESWLAGYGTQYQLEQIGGDYGRSKEKHRHR